MESQNSRDEELRKLFGQVQEAKFNHVNEKLDNLVKTINELKEEVKKSSYSRHKTDMLCNETKRIRALERFIEQYPKLSWGMFIAILFTTTVIIPLNAKEVREFLPFLN